MASPRVSKLCAGVVLLVSACGRSQLSGWLLTETGTEPTPSTSSTTTATTGGGGGQVNAAGPALATATVAGETSAGGAVATTGRGPAGGASSEGGEGGEAPDDLVLEPSELAPGRYQLDYSASFSASGGSGPYEFRLTDGELPPGLSLAGDGTLRGVPSFPGTWSFVIEVTDESGARGEREYALEIERNSLMVASLRVGSALERQDALLIDLSAPGDGLLHREEWNRNLEFSPDGRWLKWNAFTEDGDTSRYVTPLVDTSSVELLALADVATDGTWCAWSPDSTKIACTTPNTDDSTFRLSFRSLTDTSLGSETLIDQAGELYFNWVGANRLTYYDADRELFVADVDDAVATTQVYLPELQAAGGPLRMDYYGSARAVVQDSTSRRFVVDLVTNAWQELPKYRYQLYSPELDFVVSSDGTSAFLHALDGLTVVGPLDISNAGDFFLSARINGTFATHSPRFAATAGGRVIVSTLVAGALDNSEVAGAYTIPVASQLAFSPDERWLAILTETELWLCDLGASGPFEAVKLGALAQSMVSFAPDSSALAFVSGEANGPTTLTVVELTNPLGFSTRAFESGYESGHTDAVGQWSNDNSYFLLWTNYSDGPQTLYAFDMLDPDGPARLIASCEGAGGSEPGCPHPGYFQPWMAWSSASQP